MATSLLRILLIGVGAPEREEISAQIRTQFDRASVWMEWADSLGDADHYLSTAGKTGGTYDHVFWMPGEHNTSDFTALERKFGIKPTILYAGGMSAGMRAVARQQQLPTLNVESELAELRSLLAESLKRKSGSTLTGERLETARQLARLEVAVARLEADKVEQQKLLQTLTEQTTKQYFAMVEQSNRVNAGLEVTQAQLREVSDRLKHLLDRYTDADHRLDDLEVVIATTVRDKDNEHAKKSALWVTAAITALAGLFTALQPLQPIIGKWFDPDRYTTPPIQAPKDPGSASKDKPTKGERK